MSQAAWSRELVRLERFPLEEFRDDVFTYEYGQHAAFLGPSDCGKTTCMIHLMVSAQEQCEHVQPVLLVMKPDKGPRYRGRSATGDKTVAGLVRDLGGRIVRDYPMRPLLPWEDKPTFSVLWPRHELERIEATEAKQSRIFDRAIRGMYGRGGYIIGADELYSLCAELDLARPVITVQTKGRSMETGLWGASQRPAHVPLWTYSSQHLLMWRDNDRNTRKRYGEISSTFDWAYVSGVIGALPHHTALYIHTPSGNMCLVG